VKVALVVDDSLVIRKMVTQTLKALGFETLDAPDGKQAIAKAKGTALALVITDFNMPVMNGIEFIRELRALPEHKFTPAVFLTTENSDKIREEARSAGATAWIVKPFHADKVVAVVNRLSV